MAKTVVEPARGAERSPLKDAPGTFLPFNLYERRKLANLRLPSQPPTQAGGDYLRIAQLERGRRSSTALRYNLNGAAPFIRRGLQGWI